MITLEVVAQGNVGPDAQSYSQGAITLAAFALAGIAIYLSRHAPLTSSGRVAGRRRPSGSRRGGVVTPGDVVAALFCAMASLAICAYLYGGLTGSGQDPAARAAMQLYGLALGLSVLSLFFALTLMLFENHPRTEIAGRYAYWIVVITGPPIIMRFMAVLAYRAGSGEDDVPEGGALWLGIGFMVLLFLGSIVFTTFGLPSRPAMLVRACDYVASRPPLPSLFAFVVVVLVATVGSLWVSTSGANPTWFVYTLMCIGMLLLSVFDFMCGCVANRRTNQRWFAKVAVSVRRAIRTWIQGRSR